MSRSIWSGSARAFLTIPREFLTILIQGAKR